jgi:hypothetical protein
MLKHILIFVFISSSLIQSQTTFQKTYGGVEEEECDAVVQTEDGGFILAASTRSYGNGNYDLYIIRTDSNGDTVWTKTFGGTGFDTANDIIKIDNANYLIAGDLDGKVYLIKIKEDGDTVWTKIIGNDDDYVVNTVKKTLDGGFIFCGNKDLEDYFILKINGDGDSLWTKTYEYGSAYSIDPTSDGGYILMIRPGNWLHPQNDFVIVKTNSQGDSVWARVYGGPNVEIGFEVQETTDGGYMLAGRKDGDIVGDSDFYLLKTNANGDSLWAKTYGGDDMDRAFTAMQTSDGGYILGGFTASFNVEYHDFYIVKTDADGDTLWTRTFGGLWQEQIEDIEETADGGFAAVGYTYSFGAGNYPNIYFVKTDASGLITEIENQENQNIFSFELKQNYPNPFNPSTKIRFTVPKDERRETKNVSLKIYDILGREIVTLVNEEKPKGSYEVEFNPVSSIKNIASGIYFYQLKAGNLVQTKKMTYLK